MSTVTWNGSNADWNTSNDWSGGQIPGALDTAAISSGSVLVGSNDYIQAGSLNLTGGSLTVNGGLTLVSSNGGNGYVPTVKIAGGSFTVDGGSLIFGAYLNAASGTVVVTNSGSVQWNGTSPSLVNGTTGSTSGLTIDLQSGFFQIEKPFDGSIKDFGGTDLLSFAGKITSESFTNNKLAISTDSGITYSLNFIGNYQSYNFAVSADGYSISYANNPSITAPTISGLTPAADSGTQGDSRTDKTPIISGTGTSGDTITVYLDNSSTPLGTTTVVNGAWSFNFQTTPSVGSHSVTATDTQGGAVSPQSTAYRFTIDPVPAPPTVTGLTSETDTGSSNSDGITKDTNVGARGTGTSGDVVKVYVDGSSVSAGSVTVTNGAWSITSLTGTLSQGTHALRATETDPYGNVSSLSQSYSVDVDTTLTTPTIGFAAMNSAAGVGDVNAAHAAAAGYTVGSVDSDASATVLFTGTLKTTGASGTVAGVGTNGSHTVDLSGFRDGTVTASISDTDTAGNTAVGQNASTTLDTTAPVASSPTLTVPENAGPTSIGITAPSDNLTASDGLTILAGALPTDGTVTLADGTAVTSGEGLTATQLTGLQFTPTPNAYGQSSTFTYTVTDGAGNATQGMAALDIGPAASPTIAGGQNTTTSLQDPMRPFTSVSITDPTNGASDSVAITLTGSAGILTGAGLIANTDGSYSLASTSPATLTSEINALVFTPAIANSGPLEATNFTLTSFSSTGATSTPTVVSYTVDSNPNQGQFGTTTNNASSPQGEVFALYEGLLGRSPDQTGAEQWVADLNAGLSLDQVTQEFLSSTEGQSHFAIGSSNSDFVNQLYEQVLGRTGDASGEAFWNEQLAAGTSRADVADGFVFSQEHTADLQPAFASGVFIADNATSETARFYYGLLNHSPDSEGLKANTQQLESTMSLTSLAQSFLSSLEYQAQTPATQTNADFVSTLYIQALGRTPDQAGGAFWADQLNNGTTSRAQVAVGIVQGMEAQQHLAGRIESGYHLA